MEPNVGVDPAVVVERKEQLVNAHRVAREQVTLAMAGSDAEMSVQRVRTDVRIDAVAALSVDPKQW
jgi:hypothetical protein